MINKLMRSVSVKDTDNKIEALEKKFLNLPQEPCPVVHKFAPGLYLREVTLPKGSIVIGHHQNFEHLNIFLKGHITFFGSEGPVDMKAPSSFVSSPGRKVAYVHEESVWMNVYVTNETDIEKLESHFLTKSGLSLLDIEQKRKVDLLTSFVDQNDFELFLKEFKLPKRFVRKISEKTDDMTDLPFGGYKFKVGKSQIEGQGLIATGNIAPNELIAPARISQKRTIAGRFTNHSPNPNAEMRRVESDDIHLFALRPIQGCLGGQDGEEITINYRDALKINLKLKSGENKCQQ